MQAYTRTDEQIHYLSQLIAKLNRNFLEPQADDSHTNLYFDPLSGRVYGRWIATPEDPRIFALDLTEFQFQWLDKRGRMSHCISISGKSMAQLEDETMKSLDGVGLSKVDLRQPLHFEIPAYSVTGKIQNQPDPAGLAQWQFFRSLANDAGATLLGYFQTEGEVRIWPHHYDTGIYAQVSGALGIGFGLAMADEMIKAPYFYLAGYGSKPFEFTGLPAIGHGHWATGAGWQGAYLALDQMSRDSYQTARNQLHEFMRNSADWYLKQAG